MNGLDPVNLIILGCEIILKGSIALGLAALLGTLLRRRFPSGAHLAWVLAFLVLISIPVVSGFVQGKSILYLNLRPAESAISTREKQVAPDTHAANAQPVSFSPGTPDWFVPAHSVENQPPGYLMLFAAAPWLPFLLAIWLLGFLAVILRSAHGLYCLSIIRHFGTRPLTSEGFIFEADRIAEELRHRRRFDLRISATEELPVPMTWGVFRPTIVLPMDAESWTESRFEATLLHELSHVRRYDFLSQLMAEFACALYWFNPLVWLSARTMRSDAELAADEAALHAGLKPSDYAAELLLLAADLGNRPIPFATLGTPAMKNSKIEFRLESILSPTAGRRGMTTVQILTAVAVAAIALPTFASLHASARARQADPDKQERTVALSNIKQAALATLMYVNDYDDAYPYVQQTASAVAVLQPYSKNLEIFRSPTKGGKFLFNMNLAGVFSTSIEEPAMTPMWIEWLPDPKLRVAVAFSDGHAKLVSTGALGDPRVKPEVAYDANHREFPGGPAPLKAYLTKRFPRAKTMHPLPADYLLPRRP